MGNEPVRYLGAGGLLTNQMPAMDQNTRKTPTIQDMFSAQGGQLGTGGVLPDGSIAKNPEEYVRQTYGMSNEQPQLHDIEPVSIGRQHASIDQDVTNSVKHQDSTRVRDAYASVDRAKFSAHGPYSKTRTPSALGGTLIMQDQTSQNL